MKHHQLLLGIELLRERELDMANRPKTERNQKIWDLWQKGWLQKSIANMLKMKVGAVSMVIRRERARRNTETTEKEG